MVTDMQYDLRSILDEGSALAMQVSHISLTQSLQNDICCLHEMQGDTKNIHLRIGI